MTLSRRLIIKGAGALGFSGTSIVRAQKAPIKIGIMLPLSGIGAEVGAQWMIGVKAAQLQWNEAGGLLGRQIEIVVRDDKFSSAGAVAAARELGGSGINLMLGGSQSPMALAVEPILPELKAVMVAPAPAAMALTHENFNRYFFRLSANALMLYSMVGNVLATRFPDVETWSMILPDSEVGRDMAHFFTRGVNGVAAKSGRSPKILSPIYTSLNKTDYKIEINGLMNSPAEGLFIGLTAAPCISLLQQGRAVGMDKKLKVIGEAGTELLIAKAMQKSTPNNLWGVTFWAPELEPFKSQFPESKKFLDAIIKMTGNKYPPGIVISTHRALFALFTAVKNANSTDSDAVINALEGLKFDTAAGPYQIRKEDHQLFGSSYFAKIAAREAAPGYGLEDVIRVNDADVIEPPTPGKKFEG